GAGADDRVPLHSAAELPRALLHGVQTEVAAAHQGFVDIETATVVDDAQLDELLSADQLDLHEAGARMPKNVVERLLKNAEQRDFHFGIGTRLQLLGPQLPADAATIAEFVQMLVHCRLQALGVELGRAQGQRQVPDFLQRLACGLLHLRDALTAGLVLEALAQPGGGHLDEGQRLAEVVVQLPRQMAALALGSLQHLRRDMQQALVRQPQLLLIPFLFADIAHHCLDAVLSVQQRRTRRDLCGKHLAIELAQQALAKACVGTIPATLQPAQALARFILARLGDVVVDIRAEQLPGTLGTKQPRRRWIDENDFVVAIDEYGIGKVVDQLPVLSLAVLQLLFGALALIDIEQRSSQLLQVAARRQFAAQQHQMVFAARAQQAQFKLQPLAAPGTVNGPLQCCAIVGVHIVNQRLQRPRARLVSSCQQPRRLRREFQYASFVDRPGTESGDALRLLELPAGFEELALAAQPLRNILSHQQVGRLPPHIQQRHGQLDLDPPTSANAVNDGAQQNEIAALKAALQIDSERRCPKRRSDVRRI